MDDIDNIGNATPPFDERMHCKTADNEIARLREENSVLKTQNSILTEENEYLKSRQYNVENISKDEKLFSKCCGIALDKFHMIYDLVSPGTNCENVKFYDRTWADSNSTNQSRCSSDDKPNKRGQNQSSERSTNFSWSLFE